MNRWAAAVQIAKARATALRQVWHAHLHNLQRQGFDRWRRSEADREPVTVPEVVVVAVTANPTPVSGERYIYIVRSFFVKCPIIAILVKNGAVVITVTTLAALSKVLVYAGHPDNTA